MSNYYKLTYFDARLRGELTRLIFAASGQKYIDERVQFVEWQKGKDKFTTPLGQLPYLTVDNNVQLPQSLAVARFAAKKANLYGDNDLEQAKTDAVVDTVNEWLNGYIQKVLRAKVEEKEASRKAFLADEVPGHLTKIEKLINLWGSNGYSVGSSLKWSDLFIWEMGFLLNTISPNLIGKYPAIVAVRKSVEANQKVADYIKNRPNTLN